MNSIDDIRYLPDDRAKRGIVIDNADIQRQQKRIAAATILLPFLGTVAAVVLACYVPITWTDLGLFLTFYVLTTLAITVGFHRHFAHRSFKTVTWMRYALGIFGCMAAQGTVIYWVATHRRHHQFSEEELDPHSPYNFKGEKIGKLRGFWHSHLGWMMDSQMTNTVKFAKDLQKDPAMAWVNKHYFLWVILGIVLPGVLGGLITMSWIGALTGMLWGGFVRMFVSHHAMWTSGSTAHILGSRPFPCKDKSTNNGFLAPINLGEAWHNNHHAFPSSAHFGLHWWQLDIGGLFISLCEKLGLIWDVRQPTRQMIEDKKAAKQAQGGRGGVELW